MATTRTVTHDYRATPAEVVALLQDPVFLRFRSESAGERNVDVRVEPRGDGVQVTVSREKDIDVPAFARAIVGAAKGAVESTFWTGSGERFVAEYTLQVDGLPVKTRGRSTFVPSTLGCLYTTDFEVSARIPLIGGRIEALVADGLAEQMRANAERNAEALVRSATRGQRSFIEALREPADEAELG
jgi:hypothetical protein